MISSSARDGNVQGGAGCRGRTQALKVYVEFTNTPYRYRYRNVASATRSGRTEVNTIHVDSDNVDFFGSIITDENEKTP